jgi:hypothetical protein
MLSCEVSINVFSHGEWHKVTSRLRWDERAPVKEEWAENEHGRRKPTGRLVLDPKKSNWFTMPETMMAKCTEGDCIRKAFPNETAGSYVHEEMDSAVTLDLTATKIAETYASEQRLKQVGAANSILIDWLDNAGIVQVPVGQLGDEAIAWVRQNASEPMTVNLWCERNRHGLQEYWGRDKAGALALKKMVEPIRAQALQAAE